MKGLQTWGAILLLASSAVLLIPALYQAISSVTAGKPWIQTLLGVAGVIVSVAMLAGRRTPSA